jgi:type III pantothenate kinase
MAAERVPSDDEPILAIAVGNTTVKAGCATCGQGGWMHRLNIRTEANGLAPLGEFIERLQPRPAQAVVASVVPGRTAAVVEILRQGGVARVGLITPGQTEILPHRLQEITRTGVDRLLAARAAWEEIRGAVIVVDAGTAITVNAVNRQGIFCGGAILPGPVGWLRGLAATGAQLPELEACILPSAQQAYALGRGPEEAIGAGLAHGLNGAVPAVVQAVRRELETHAPLVLTGGGITRLQEVLSGALVRPDLVLDGIRLLAEDGAVRMTEADGRNRAPGAGA